MYLCGHLLGKSCPLDFPLLLFNPYKPGVPCLGQRQTVQTQIRVFTVCLQEFLFETEYNSHLLNWKWTRPVDKDGRVHSANMVNTYTHLMTSLVFVLVSGESPLYRFLIISGVKSCHKFTVV